MSTDRLTRPILGAVLIFAGTLVFFSSVSAEAEPNIQYPVAELGGCASKEACRVYCDEGSHLEACLNFAERNGMMNDSELAQARKFLAAGGKGPGGCTSKNTCEAFCNDTTNIKECVAFAEQSGLMPPEELAQARKVMQALESGIAFPGGCKNKNECDAYCNSSDSSHLKECMKFARAAGFMSAEEAAQADKVLQALEKGVRMPKCRGQQECDVYCSKEENIVECMDFAVAAGFMSESDAAVMKKTGGKGPGGCVGKACDAFCKDPANQEVCFQFAKDNGLISAEEIKKIEEEKKNGGDKDLFKNEFDRMPAEVRDCLRSNLGEEVDKMLAGQAPSANAAAFMRSCFDQIKRTPVENMRPAAPNNSSGPFPDRSYGPLPGAEEGQLPESYQRPPEGSDFPNQGNQPGEPPADLRERLPQQNQEGAAAPTDGNTSSQPPATGNEPAQPVAPAAPIEMVPASDSRPSGLLNTSESAMASLLNIFLGIFDR